jgi:hypothetical protein
VEEWTSLCIVEKLNVLLSIFKGIECIVVTNMGHVSKASLEFCLDLFILLGFFFNAILMLKTI